MSETEMIRVEFYGANGYCLECHQPLEGRGCPYCGWEDKSPAQHGYVPKMKKSSELDALQAERDLLRQQLEVAMKNLIIIKSGGEITYWSERFQATVHNDIPKDIAGKALAEIAKLGEKK